MKFLLVLVGVTIAVTAALPVEPEAVPEIHPGIRFLGPVVITAESVDEGQEDELVRKARQFEVIDIDIDIENYGGNYGGRGGGFGSPYGIPYGGQFGGGYGNPYGNVYHGGYGR